MKTKILALIIAVPVAAFAVSTAIHPGGDKDKTKTKSDTPTPQEQVANAPEPAMQQATGSQAEANAAPAPDNGLSTAELAKELALGLAYMEEKKNTLFDDVEEWHWDLTEETEEMLDEKMLVPVRRAMNYDIDGDMFSRCPSGVEARVFALNESKDRGEGFLTRARGCRVLPMSKFRYDLTAGTISLWVSEQAGYVSVDRWVKAYKEMERNQEEKQG